MARVTPDMVLATVERIMARPWDWARDWNCLGDAADVFRAVWGVDPAPGLRGLARTFGGARRLVRGAGGLIALAEREFQAAGLVKGPAMPGAIGIASTTAAAGFGGRAAVICITPGQWAGKGPRGVTVIPHSGEGWSCPH